MLRISIVIRRLMVGQQACRRIVHCWVLASSFGKQKRRGFQPSLHPSQRTPPSALGCLATLNILNQTEPRLSWLGHSFFRKMRIIVIVPTIVRVKCSPWPSVYHYDDPNSRQQAIMDTIIISITLLSNCHRYHHHHHRRSPPSLPYCGPFALSASS